MLNIRNQKTGKYLDEDKGQDILSQLSEGGQYAISELLNSEYTQLTEHDIQEMLEVGLIRRIQETDLVEINEVGREKGIAIKNGDGSVFRN